MASGNILGGIASRVKAIINGQIQSFSRWTVAVQNFSVTAVNYVSNKIRDFMSTLLNRPKSKKDYFHVLDMYISKRFVFLSVIAVCFGGPVVVSYFLPMVEGRLWSAKIRVDSNKLQTFSGKVKIVNTAGKLIYKGSVVNGAPTGSGFHYDSDGNVIFKGEFKNGKYDGEGQYFADGKNLIYAGGFKNNLYHGTGKLYNPSTGKLLYEGAFENGVKSGKGTEYDPDTSAKMYFGEYLDGVRSGQGVEYTEDGSSVYYEGGFLFGKYDGQGKIYSGRNLVYKGGFSNGNKDGNGTLFNAETGNIIYIGDFKEGKYHGNGELHDEKSGALVYNGEFSEGKYKGEGTSFDKLGGEIFSGNFYNGSIDYIGCLGQNIDQLVEKFGNETFRTEIDSKLILAFTGNDFVAVMKINNEKNEYTCEKLLIGTKNDFMGISSKSTAAERREILGDPTTTSTFSVPEYYKTAFANLAINITNPKSIPYDKYLISGTSKYFLRLYFNQGKTELKFVEVCGI